MVFHVRATFMIELKGGRVVFYKQRGAGVFLVPKISRGAKDEQGRVNAPPPLNAALHVNVCVSVYVCVYLCV